jgi:AraC family transcriptional regulator
MSNTSRPSNDATAQGLPFCRAAASNAAPRYHTDRMAPFRTIGLDATASLKASFWRSTVEEAKQLGDLDYVSIAMNLGGGRVWRNNESVPTEVGAIAMHPFEGAHWRFDRPVSFVKLYLPFGLVGDVCEALFDRELTPAGLRMPIAIRDEGFCGAAHRIQSNLLVSTPTNLILDSWSLILSELVVRGFYRYANRHSHPSLGKIPARSVARVVDYIESSLDQDLRLGQLANVAAMSVYHFARRFRETVGVSPHAYVLSRRLDRARGMLRNREVALAQVAAACGFSSQAHLTTSFLNAFGATPGKYRRGL